MKRFLAAIVDLFYPRDCFFCDAPVDAPGRMVCPPCKRGILPPGHARCAICSAELAHGLSGAFICSACCSAPPAYARAVVGAKFSGYVRALLIYFKYLHGFWLCRDLVDILEPVCRAAFAEEAIDLVAPVPMSRRKKNRRGYNQAALLARELANRLNLPCSERILARADALTQTRMTAAERRRNARRSFSVRRFPEKLKGKTILLVDDVMTTGSTFSTCARLLKRAGAGRVLVAAVARTPHR